MIASPVLEIFAAWNTRKVKVCKALMLMKIKNTATGNTMFVVFLLYCLIGKGGEALDCQLTVGLQVF